MSQLLPMKQGRFFDGRLSDDETSLRVAGFDAKKLEELVQLKEEGSEQDYKWDSSQWFSYVHSHEILFWCCTL